jgi:hypothetical protein
MTRFRPGYVESDIVNSSFLVELDDRVEDGVPQDRPAKNDAESDSDLRLVEVAREPCLDQPNEDDSAELDCFRLRYATKYLRPYDTLNEKDASEESDTYDPFSSMEFLLFSNGAFLYETGSDPEDCIRFLFGEDIPTYEAGTEIILPTLRQHYRDKDEVSKVTLHDLEPGSMPTDSDSDLVAAVDQFAGIVDNITVSTSGAEDQDLRNADLVGMLLDRSRMTYLSASYEDGNATELSRSGWMQSSFPEGAEPERRAQFIQNRFAPVIEQVASMNS